MMNQFVVVNGRLCVIDNSRWDYAWGFYRILRVLPDESVVTP